MLLSAIVLVAWTPQAPRYPIGSRRAVQPLAQDRSVLVVGSINIDLFTKLDRDSLCIDGSPCDVSAFKGMTLPAESFAEQLRGKVVLRGPVAEQLRGMDPVSLIQAVDGPFVQKTGGKGANAAAAAGQTAQCEFIGNLGRASSEANEALLADLSRCGGVETARCALLDGPTGTAYILQFEDNDNAIVLVGGANQCWPEPGALMGSEESAGLREAIGGAAALMLQREVPEYVNLAVAKHAAAVGTPVFMDVGGTDAALDAALLPFLSVLAPNESELTFISGVETRGSDGKPKLGLVRDAVGELKAQAAAAGNAAAEVLVTFGGEGSMYFGGEWERSAEAQADGFLPHETRSGTFSLGTPDGRPRDTTGAGDCFRGSYVAARYVRGMSVSESMKWASAAASLACETEGAMVSMPERGEIEKRVLGEMRVPPL